MIKFFKVWWPALLVLALGLAFYFYGEKKADEATDKTKDKAQIESLKTDNDAKDETIKIRTKQNEARNNRPSDTPAFIDCLLQDDCF